MQEKDAAAPKPTTERCGIDLTSVAWGLVRQAYAHMMDFYVRNKLAAALLQTNVK